MTASVRIREWLGPVAFGIIEQIILSGVNFAFTAAMAHQLGALSFGWLSIAWAVMLFLETSSQGVFGDAVPASARRLPASIRTHFRSAFLILSFLYSLIILAISFFIWIIADYISLEHAELIPATVLAFVGLRAQNAARRLYYLDGFRTQAALAAVINAASMAVGSIIMVWVLDNHSPTTAMLIVALSNIISSAVLFTQGGSLPLARPSRAIIRWTRLRLWQTGRWLMVSNSMSWLGNFGLVVVLGALIGVAASGSLRVIMTLTNPPAQLVLVLMSVIVPKVSSKTKSEIQKTQWALALKSMVAIGSVTATYALAMTLLGNWLPVTLFGAPAIGITALTVAIATFGYAFEAVRYGCNVVLLSTGRTSIITIGQISAIFSAAVLVPLASARSLDWVIAAITVSNNVNTIVVLFFVIYATRPRTRLT